MVNTNNAANNCSDPRNISLVSGNNTISSLPGQSASAQNCYIMWFQYFGSGLDIRQVYLVAHDALGGAGLINLLATMKNLNTTGGLFTPVSLTVNSSGIIIANATITSGSFSALARLTPIGLTYNVQFL